MVLIMMVTVADNNENICSDVDGDTCDDCSDGSYGLDDDGFDYDGDGLCDDGDPDDDNDGALDGDDSADNDEFVCSDNDGDTCDDCSDGSYGLDDDGADNDLGWELGDGETLCDDGDADDDNDGALDDDDSSPFNPYECSDDDGDTCDDCATGSYNTENEGGGIESSNPLDDTDSDGICNAGDTTPHGELSLSFGEAGQMNIDINYSSTNPIGGYQFQVNGVTLTAAYDSFDLIDFNASNGMVLGVSTMGENLPAGDGILIHLEFEAIDGGSDISLSGIQFGDADGNEMTVSGPESADIPACDNNDADGICDVYDDDDDNDGVSDGDDSDPFDNFLCGDTDGDTCEDCSSGSSDTSNDGDDNDGDGWCNAGDNWPDCSNDPIDEDPYDLCGMCNGGTTGPATGYMDCNGECAIDTPVSCEGAACGTAIIITGATIIF